MRLSAWGWVFEAVKPIAFSVSPLNLRVAVPYNLQSISNLNESCDDTTWETL